MAPHIYIFYTFGFTCCFNSFYVKRQSAIVVTPDSTIKTHTHFLINSMFICAATLVPHHFPTNVPTSPAKMQGISAVVKIPLVTRAPFVKSMLIEKKACSVPRYTFLSSSETDKIYRAIGGPPIPNRPVPIPERDEQMTAANSDPFRWIRFEKIM